MNVIYFKIIAQKFAGEDQINIHQLLIESVYGIYRPGFDFMSDGYT